MFYPVLISPVIATNNIRRAGLAGAGAGAGRHGCAGTVCGIHTFYYWFVDFIQLLFYVNFFICFNQAVDRKHF